MPNIIVFVSEARCTGFKILFILLYRFVSTCKLSSTRLHFGGEEVSDLLTQVVAIEFLRDTLDADDPSGEESSIALGLEIGRNEGPRILVELGLGDLVGLFLGENLVVH